MEVARHFRAPAGVGRVHGVRATPPSHLTCSAGTPPYKSLSLLCRAQASLRRRGASEPEEEFHRAADRALEHLSDRFDALLDDNDIAGSDLEYGVRQQPSSV